MNGRTLVGILLIVGGILALVYGQMTYTKATHEAKLGPFELAVKEKETVHFPTWIGIGGIVLGAVVLVTARKK